ncbi:PREDICTED: LRR receptor-like serine/threonine-protein kinase FLS2 [Nicotiana attenuata]|uniref:Lrr receptor-like serinethreonine-protein kinase n=1 Tax=Nicotiana attenuata TaxID=49451 RepID=A0A1J6IBL7_NICAT|nr:PREDICTED: LRR receptor-like serine/threonine-protein kinase FLS2 [Nicotiana attenuata]OIT02318.1 putative lrr receptor-like serinethreonine-protein kinase [Nicotiana attenuata]
MSKSTNSVFFFFFLYLCLSLVQSIPPSSDIMALQAFKAAIKPSSIPSYSCLGSWNFTSDPCSVPRVTHFTCGLSCSSGNRVTELTLDPAGYSGTLTPLISKLTQLVTLDLQNNNFYGPIPASLSSIPNLKNLVLRLNSFSGSVPPSLTSLKSLLSLDLSHNSISGLPNSMNQLTSLRRLDLSYNKLTGSLPKLPPNVIELAAKANSLSGSLLKLSFDGLNQLEVVELSENSLSGSIEAWFFQLPSLQQVDMAKNGFTRVEISKTGNLNSDLVAVDLSFNKIEGYLPVNFAGFPRLSSLSLSYNRFRGPIPWQYSKKVTLKRLYLDGNFLNGSPPAGFFGRQTGVTGSLGDNCLQKCPTSSQLCLKSQKPTSICQQAYGGKPKS